MRASSASSAPAIWEKEIAVEGVDVFPSPKYVRVHLFLNIDCFLFRIKLQSSIYMHPVSCIELKLAGF